MARTSQLLHPQREPAPLRPAATVLLLRDGPQGIEVLMTRRSMTASFAPGAYVFPGGGVDAADAAAHSQSSRRPGQNDLHLTQAIAAIRESFEELGLLFARHADGPIQGLRRRHLPTTQTHWHGFGEIVIVFLVLLTGTPRPYQVRTKRLSHRPLHSHEDPWL